MTNILPQTFQDWLDGPLRPLCWSGHGSTQGACRAVYHDSPDTKLVARDLEARAAKVPVDRLPEKFRLTALTLAIGRVEERRGLRSLLNVLLGDDK